MLRLLARHLRRPPVPAEPSPVDVPTLHEVAGGVLEGLPLRLNAPVDQDLAELFAAERAREDAAPVIVLLDATGARGARVAVALGRVLDEPVERVLVQAAPDERTLAEVHRVAAQDGRGARVGLLQVEALSGQPQGRDAALALLGQADLAVLIADPPAGGALMDELLDVAQGPHWRCPALLLMLPPAAAPDAAAWRAQPWPLRLQVQVVAEALPDAEGVWQRVRQHWDTLRAPRQRIFQALMDVTLAGTAAPPETGGALPPLTPGDLGAAGVPASPPAAIAPLPAAPGLPPLRADQLAAPGVLGPLGDAGDTVLAAGRAPAPAELFPGSLPTVSPTLQVALIALARERGVMAAWLVDTAARCLLEAAGPHDDDEAWCQALAWWDARPDGQPAPRHLLLDLGDRALLWWPLPAVPGRALCLLLSPRNADLDLLRWQVEIALGTIGTP
jgi:hypothetical protein